MEGAKVAGDILARAKAAYEAGCDMLLVCNRPDLAAELLDRWAPAPDSESLARIAALAPVRLRLTQPTDPFALEVHGPYLAARTLVQAIPADTATGTVMAAAIIGDKKES
jgi:beta-N-acetylhexosaminidase